MKLKIMIKVFWHRSTNFGDALTPYVLDKLGIEYEYVDKGCQEEHYIMNGSILTAANEHSIVWGAGIAQPAPFVNPKKICAVRDDMAYYFVRLHGIEENIELGDLSLLLPIIYPKKHEPVSNRLGIINHVINPDKGTFSVESPVEELIDYIHTCEFIQTESLHVYMTCMFYGIPCDFFENYDVMNGYNKMMSFFETRTFKRYNMKGFINSCPIPEMKEKLLKLI